MTKRSPITQRMFAMTRETKILHFPKDLCEEVVEEFLEAWRKREVDVVFLIWREPRRDDGLIRFYWWGQGPFTCTTILGLLERAKEIVFEYIRKHTS